MLEIVIDNRELFDEDGTTVRLTEKGWCILWEYCRAVILKRCGKRPYTDDLVITALMNCVEALQDYDHSKRTKISTYLYFKILGTISTEANKVKKLKNEVLVDFTEERKKNDQY